ncbi:inorganic pyrophosphatase-like [Hetaerina americana]|uniref:inorganic pyrophosphatase-like n=1 Tax=Hetaerina americana TaxID=62018 RepID=UPI003A7F35ED
MVIEMPRWTNAKMEMSLDEPLNPIKQDTSGGKLRYVPNCFPFHGIPWNYGALPQTLEDPNIIDEFTKLKGDGDPVDAIEIGQRLPSCGEILQVKVLGALALVDRNKIDWKLIVLSVDDELSGVINNLSDIDSSFPNLLSAVKEWFQVFKVVAGKPENYICFNGEIQEREVAHLVIKSAHNSWKNLINDCNPSSIFCCNVTHYGNPHNVTIADAETIVKASPTPEKPHPKDPSVDLWHFVHKK